MGLVRELMHSREGPLLMGVLNRTPDSFSDGGSFLDDDAALRRAHEMIADGAAIIDVGAESTRPGSPRIDAREQLARLGPIVKQLSRAGAVVSVDTTDPEVSACALQDGARIINCVDPERAAELARLARRHDADLVIMHSRGAMATMRGFGEQEESTYRDVVASVAAELEAARDAATRAGLDRASITLDPGLGFHKSAAHSLRLCVELDRLSQLGCPLLVGPSRKSFLVQVTGSSATLAPPERRLGATIAACLLCAKAGAAVLRVHDVEAVAQALAFSRAAQAPSLALASEEARAHA